MCKGYSYFELLNLVPELYSDCILIWTLTHISRSCHHTAVCWGEEHGWRGPGKARGDSLLTGLLSSIILSLNSSTLNITKLVFLNASISCFRFLLFAYLYILTFPKWNYIRKLFLQVKSATPLSPFHPQRTAPRHPGTRRPLLWPRAGPLRRLLHERVRSLHLPPSRPSLRSCSCSSTRRWPCSPSPIKITSPDTDPITFDAIYTCRPKRQLPSP